jgi:hypothetical protein
MTSDRKRPAGPPTSAGVLARQHDGLIALRATLHAWR